MLLLPLAFVDVCHPKLVFVDLCRLDDICYHPHYFNSLICRTKSRFLATKARFNFVHTFLLSLTF